MNDDPFPVESGTFGKVDHVDDIGTVHCVFDNGRTLGVIPGVDDFHIVSEDNMSHIDSGLIFQSAIYMFVSKYVVKNILLC